MHAQNYMQWIKWTCRRWNFCSCRICVCFVVKYWNHSSNVRFMTIGPMFHSTGCWSSFNRLHGKDLTVIVYALAFRRSDCASSLGVLLLSTCWLIFFSPRLIGEKVNPWLSMRQLHYEIKWSIIVWVSWTLAICPQPWQNWFVRQEYSWSWTLQNL